VKSQVVYLFKRMVAKDLAPFINQGEEFDKHQAK
jgi:hypothetical protein